MRKTISILSGIFFMLQAASFAVAGDSQPNIPVLQPFSSPGSQVVSGPPPLSDKERRDTIERSIIKSGQRTNIIIPMAEFNAKLKQAGLLSFEFVPDPINTVYIFTDPKCPLCAQAYKQIVEQKALFEARKVNVKWLPIVQSGETVLYNKAVHLFANDLHHQDTSPNEAREMVRSNTELFATSFGAIATPLVFWPVENGGYEVILGFVKPNRTKSFLANVASKGTFLDFVDSLAKR